MSGRFLLESLLMCALVWGGVYLVLGSMHSVEGTLITLGNFFAQSGEALIRSPRMMIGMSASACLVMFVVSRAMSTRAVR